MRIIIKSSFAKISQSFFSLFVHLIIYNFVFATRTYTIFIVVMPVLSVNTISHLVEEVYTWDIYSSKSKKDRAISLFGEHLTGRRHPHDCKPSHNSFKYVWGEKESGSIAKWLTIPSWYKIYYVGTAGETTSVSLSSSNHSSSSDTYNVLNPKRVYQVRTEHIAHVKPHCLSPAHGNSLDKFLNNSITKSNALRAYLNCVFDAPFSSSTPIHRLRIAVFNDVWVNRYGSIVSPHSCLFVRNGGCLTQNHTKLFRFYNTTRRERLVISLGSEASGNWHMPMEGVVALAGMDSRILRQAMVHVPFRTRMVMDWLRVLGVMPWQVTAHWFIRAKTLLVPEMGLCGAPYISQLLWMRRTYLRAIKLKPLVSASRPVTVLLIKRRKRGFDNYDEVEREVRSFAQSRGIRVVVHGDTPQELPSVIDQVERFSAADVIVGPHGAALLFTTFAPAHACIVEYMLAKQPLCYARLAYLLGFSYLQLSFNGNQTGNFTGTGTGNVVETGNSNVNLMQLRIALENCASSVPTP